MSITKFILSSKYTVYALTIGAAIFGAIAYKTMPMQLFPDTAPPLVNVITVYPGASAEDIAENLSKVLEEEFASLEGIVKIKSTSQNNVSLISVEFQYTRNVDLAALDVQNAISSVRNKLPSGIKEPQILKFSTNDRPIISIGVAHKDMKKARKLAEDVISKKFQQVNGVAAVDLFGGSVRAVIVDVDLAKAKAYKVPLLKIMKTIKEQNVTMPAGQVRTERNMLNYRLEARVKDLDELRKLPISVPGGKILLSDIAKIYQGSLDDESHFSINGKKYIALQVYKTTEANTIEVVGNIQKVLKRLEDKYRDYSFTVGEESATFADISTSNLTDNIWEALIFASIIIFLFIGKFNLSMVAVVSMPLSYGITFAFMKLAGIEFNMVTLSAVILAVGMVVDAAVVVLENISRKYQEGLSKNDAVIEGADEVYIPVIAGASTTIAVLIPLLFTGGFTGKTFAPLALTLLFAFSSSVMVALILIPVMTYFALTDNILDKMGMYIIKPFTFIMDLVGKFYGLLLKLALKQRILTIILVLIAMVGGMKLLKGQGMETLPKMDNGSFSVSFETPSGTSLEDTVKVAQEVERILGKEKEVKIIQTQAGFEEGMKSVSSSGAQGPTQCLITVTLTPRTERTESVWDIEQRVRKEIAKVPNIKVFTVRDIGNTAKATTKAPIVILLKGEDPLVLNKLGNELLEEIAKTPGVVEPVRNWYIDQRQKVVSVNRLAANNAGISPFEIAQQLQMGSYGAVSGDYYGHEDTSVPVQLKYDLPEYASDAVLSDFPILIPSSGQIIPLRTVINIKEKKVRPMVSREDQIATLEISAFTKDYPVSTVLANVEKVMKKFKVPEGYKLELTGEKKDMGESKRELGGALSISLILVYLILVSQLRSFVLPVLIMATIPLSLIGVAIALFLTGKPVSMPVMVGLILLAGTVVNNAIILIDFITHSKAEGKDSEIAVKDSVRIRFRPIMMTSLSTIIGMIPLAAEWALGAERFSPLAVAVIGGMTMATLLTLVVIPVLYSMTDSVATFFKTKLFKTVKE